MTLVLAGVFLVSTTLLLRQFLDNSGGEDAYSAALAIASQESRSRQEDLPPVTEETEPALPQTIWVPEAVEDDPQVEELLSVDLAALREVNEDVVGWIRVPGTKIDYPLMQGEDNDYYLKHTWEGRNNSVGSIFLEHLSSPDLADFNTIVYGHNMKNGSMFASLRKYTQEGYWEQHPYVYILSDAGVYRYEIFAAYKVTLDSPAYGLSFNQSVTRINFLTHALENTQIQTGIIPDLTDRILTLSTCSGAGHTTRWLVQARLKMVQEEVQ